MLRFVLLGLTFFTTLAPTLGVETSKVPVETQASVFVQRVLRGSTDLDFRQLQQGRVCAEEDFVGCNTDDFLDDHSFTSEMTESCGTFYQESLDAWCFDPSRGKEVCCGSEDYCCEAKVGLIATVIGVGIILFITVTVVLCTMCPFGCRRSSQKDKLSSLTIYSPKITQHIQSARPATQSRGAVQSNTSTRAVQEHLTHTNEVVHGPSEPRAPSKLLTVLHSFASELQNMGQSESRNNLTDTDMGQSTGEEHPTGTSGISSSNLPEKPSRSSTPSNTSTASSISPPINISVSSKPQKKAETLTPQPISIDDDQPSAPPLPTSGKVVVCPVCEGNGKMSYSGKPALRGGKPCKLCDTKGVVALEKGTKLEICVLCNGMGAFDSSRNPTTAYGTQYDKSCHNCNGRCFLRIKLKEQRQKKYSMAEVECKACKGMGKFDGTWATPSRNGQVNCVPCGATGKVSIEEGETLEKCIKCNGQGGENSVGAPTKYHYGYCYDHAWYTAPCWNCNGRCFAVGSSSPQKFPAANVECPLCQGGEDRKGCPSCRDTRKVCLKYGERLSPCIICQGKGGFWMGGPSSFFSGWKQEDCNGCKGRGYDRVGGSVVDGASDSD